MARRRDRHPAPSLALPGAPSGAEAALDQIDRRLLGALQEAGRLANNDLAERVGLSASACLRRVRRLEALGVIRGYAALLDGARLGLALTVVVSVRLERQDLGAIERFEAEVASLPEVLVCHRLMGDLDYELQVVAQDLAGYERWYMRHLAGIEGVASLSSRVVMKMVKQSTALPLDRDPPAPRS
jgi:Lrp/AsnC family transcriptional regulator, leucine-responsive regulatory protein